MLRSRRRPLPPPLALAVARGFGLYRPVLCCGGRGWREGNRLMMRLVACDSCVVW